VNYPALLLRKKNMFLLVIIFVIRIWILNLRHSWSESTGLEWHWRRNRIKRVGRS